VASGFAGDPHSEQGFLCPRNLFGITDYAELQRYEGPLVAKRGGELEERPVSGRFDIAHLRAIHRHLFQDVFPWAGEFRVVNLSKGNSMFGPALYIESALGELLAKLKAEGFLKNLNADAFAARAAYYLGEINAIHPFREGNGRTQREFIRQLALDAGQGISWAGFTQEQMVAASILSHTRGDCSLLTAILRVAIVSPRGSKTEG
jgi:cell filamentation protein